MDDMGHMGSGLPALGDFPGFYYAVVGSAVGVAALVNVYNYLLYRQRLAAAAQAAPTPAKPTSWFALGNATAYALAREASNYSVRIPVRDRIIKFPTIGRTSLILANIVVLVVLCLYGLDLESQLNRETVGFRCGIVTLSQVPIIVLLAGKNNIVGYLSGISYERINWIHRWCARCMLLTATMHMGYFLSAWAPYDYIGYQIKNNEFVWKGLGAYCTLVWIVFSSLAPIRGWSYEVFVIQHIVSFAVFIFFVYIHSPINRRGYVWAPIAIFLFDRVFRAVRLLYINLSLFHPSQRKHGQMKGLWACKAEFTPLPNNTTRIVVRNPPISWTPGQHVYLSCHSVVPLQSHPFTIASIPEDGKMEFFVKAEKGGTKQFYKHAEKSGRSPEPLAKYRPITIEGPYGILRPLRQFDSVVLLAGSTGCTFTMPLLRDLIHGWHEKANGTSSKKSILWAPSGSVTRHIRFVWVVKSSGQLSWFSEKLSSIYTEFQGLQERLRDIKLEMSVYITCDPAFTDGHKSGVTTNAATASSREKEQIHGLAQYDPISPPPPASAPPPTYSKQDSNDAIREIKHSRITSIDSDDGRPCTPQNALSASACCCRSPISEFQPLTRRQVCHCAATSAPQQASPASGISKSKSRPTSRPHVTADTRPASHDLAVHPSIAILAGRPEIRNLVRRSLEQAWGESAVVACGPLSLVADVKHHVVALSDERAVHKGTGAQGIYLHTESFGW